MTRYLCFATFLLATIVFFPNMHGQAKPASVPSAAPVKPPLEWDIVSIKKHDPNDATMRWGSTNDGMGGVGMSLRTLLSQAYGFDEPELRDEELIGLPAWAKDARYDITAKVSDEDAPAWKRFEDMSMEETIQHLVGHDPTPDMLMMRNLLETRFGLKVHYETRTGPIYDLTVDKGGEKLKPAADMKHGNVNWDAGLMKADGVPTQVLAMVLSMPLQRSVHDRTGLTGHYDFELHFQPYGAPPNADDNNPDLFTAVREQLGLRLESAKGPVLVVVVDSVHEPSPN